MSERIDESTILDAERFLSGDGTDDPRRLDDIEFCEAVAAAVLLRDGLAGVQLQSTTPFVRPAAKSQHRAGRSTAGSRAAAGLAAAIALSAALVVTLTVRPASDALPGGEADDGLAAVWGDVDADWTSQSDVDDSGEVDVIPEGRFAEDEPDVPSWMLAAVEFDDADRADDLPAIPNDAGVL